MGRVSDQDWVRSDIMANQENNEWESKRTSGIKEEGGDNEAIHFSSSGSCLLTRLLLVPRVVFDFGIDRNLHVESTVGVIWDNVAVVIHIFALGIQNTALAVTVNLGTLLPNFTDGVSLVWVRVDVENRVGGVDRVRTGGPGSCSGRVGTRVGTRERSASNERTTNGENDAHSHSGRQNSSHTEL